MKNDIQLANELQIIHFFLDQFKIPAIKDDFQHVRRVSSNMSHNNGEV